MNVSRFLFGLVASSALGYVEPGVCRGELPQVTASSEWGPGYGAAAAADEVASENGNYWQTVQGQDRGAWWQRDLGQKTTLREVNITWAQWEDRVHCPPASMVIQVSLTGAADSWINVLKVGPADIP